ncbi:MAG: Na+/H+ antiporter NhaA type [uncultured Thermomicrobiales bacterium]|uniref:Na(+)/H(+) antiporter NhaA n=1 Tax=uncultured Thermomicrobiales bacterium TaxID=1645740 RepID=A0A6J4UQX2_9BACT|nr:MAG: Na+/H+ antiporter NhaA type [uncultured Thermomicrobiales bacterium]
MGTGDDTLTGGATPTAAATSDGDDPSTAGASPGTADAAGEATTNPGDGQPVTFSFSRRIRMGREAEFAALAEEITADISTFPGVLDVRTFPPRGTERDYRWVTRFVSEADVHTWKTSPHREEFNRRADPLTEDDAPVVTNLTGTARDRTVVLALTPFQDFVRTSVSGIGLLLLGTLLAIIMANSPMADRYDAFWDAHLRIGGDGWGIDESLRHWVNDGLMALFFFIMGLEIKREVLVGELRYPRQAALPIAAAAGGVIVPALVFYAINAGGDGEMGWGIPMATDTAFVLGVLTLLGTRVRPLLLVFLTALAIVDDVLAVGVIAVFYTDRVDWLAAFIAVGLLCVLAGVNVLGFHRWPVYAVLGVAVWVAVFESGIHGTLAGILVALTVPARSWINPSEFLLRGRQAIDDFERACYIAPSILSNEPQQQATQQLERLCEDVTTPMTHFQDRLNPFVAYVILPVFAFANAGIALTEGVGDALGSAVTWGVVAGLLVGKPIGITLFAWIAVRTGLAVKPVAIAWSHIASVGILGGVGFTVSLFVTELAFGEEPFADAARIGILIGSLVAGAVGYLALRRTLPPPREEPA